MDDGFYPLSAEEVNFKVSLFIYFLLTVWMKQFKYYKTMFSSCYC